MKCKCRFCANLQFDDDLETPYCKQYRKNISVSSSKKVRECEHFIKCFDLYDEKEYKPIREYNKKTKTEGQQKLFN